MSGSIKPEQPDNDRTEDYDFLMEHADRVLAWEVIHTGLALNRHLAPSRIAKAIGLETADLHDIINEMNCKLPHPPVL